MHYCTISVQILAIVGQSANQPDTVNILAHLNVLPGSLKCKWNIHSFTIPSGEWTILLYACGNCTWYSVGIETLNYIQCQYQTILCEIRHLCVCVFLYEYSHPLYKYTNILQLDDDDDDDDCQIDVGSLL